MRLCANQTKPKCHGAAWRLALVLLVTPWAPLVAQDQPTEPTTYPAQTQAPGVLTAPTRAPKTTKSPNPAKSKDKPEKPIQQFFAYVTEVHGKHVQVSADQGRTWQAVQRGMKLSANARLRSGFASHCQVNFGGHSVVQLEPLSSMRLSDYSGRDDSRRVRTKLHYGAVRCGVERGRLKVATEIATPVSTLSIRGTLVYVEYDPGMRTCLLKVDEDGPALARAAAIGRGPCLGRDCAQNDVDNALHNQQSTDPLYELNAPMYTDCVLSRYLKLAVFERQTWAVGNYLLGDLSDAEADSIAMLGGFDESSEGHLEYDSDRLRDASRVVESVSDFPGGDIPIGQTPTSKR